jgi:hypothetical protein
MSCGTVACFVSWHAKVKKDETAAYCLCVTKRSYGEAVLRFRLNGTIPAVAVPDKCADRMRIALGQLAKHSLFHNVVMIEDQQRQEGSGRVTIAPRVLLLRGTVGPSAGQAGVVSWVCHQNGKHLSVF